MKEAPRQEGGYSVPGKVPPAAVFQEVDRRGAPGITLGIVHEVLAAAERVTGRIIILAPGTRVFPHTDLPVLFDVEAVRAAMPEHNLHPDTVRAVLDALRRVMCGKGDPM
ncbi:MAG: hypothetical protein AB7E47_03190 [Desulfovibrionaceae bacterium]